VLLKLMDVSGAFEKLRKATGSFFMSVRPSVHPHGTLGNHWTVDGFC
jgi:hypothetical protein